MGVGTQKKEPGEVPGVTNELFYRAFKSSPNLMAITTCDGHFIEVNDSFERTTGYSRGEVTGRTLSELKLFGQQESTKLLSIVHNSKSLDNVESFIQTKGGSKRFGTFFADVIDIGIEKYILIMFNDITEIKKAQETLQKSEKRIERELARLERLDLVGEMAAGIGHEIRNPLTTVRGLLQILGKKEEFITYTDSFQIMIDELDRANAIITEFLSLAKNRPLNMKKQSLNPVIEAISPLIAARAADSNLHVVVETGDIPDIMMDDKEIRRLIHNLCSNGLEAMSPGGCLKIKTYTDRDEVVLMVQDQGEGIKDEELDKIGFPFFTTKENGTGLGLAVCYGVASRHNAVISVETDSRGTSFSVRFKI
ncbi:MAG: two-component system sensor histidine kinase NtrB [Bacillota bacterium]